MKFVLLLHKILSNRIYFFVSGKHEICVNFWHQTRNRRLNNSDLQKFILCSPDPTTNSKTTVLTNWTSQIATAGLCFWRKKSIIKGKKQDSYALSFYGSKMIFDRPNYISDSLYIFFQCFINLWETW